MAVPRPGPPRRKITNYNWSISRAASADRLEAEANERAARAQREQEQAAELAEMARRDRELRELAQKHTAQAEKLDPGGPWPDDVEGRPDS